MRGLFEAFVVDPKRGTILVEHKLIADGDDNARLKAAVMANYEGDIDDLDIIVRRIGNVRAKEKPQDVRVVKE